MDYGFTAGLEEDLDAAMAADERAKKLAEIDTRLAELSKQLVSAK